MYYATLIGGNEETRKLFKDMAKEMGAVASFDLDKGEIPPKEMLEDIRNSFNSSKQKEE